MKKRTLFFKKFNRMLAAALMVPALTFFVACSDDENDATGDPNTIANMPGTLALAAEGSPVTANLSFVANSAWEASSEDTWFEFTPKSGQAGNVTITVTTTYNLGATKTGTLTIKHGTQTYTVKISQNGKPDLAIWEPEDLYDVSAFAPDPYNVTEEMPASFEFTVKTNNDYKTLEEAPYQIMVFAVDQDYEPIKDQQIDWVEFKIAENSPVASEGKKIVLSVKPHEEFTTIEKDNGVVTQMNDRYAYITIVPKGTEVDAIFNADGTIKEEYTGASIEQKAYTGKIGKQPGPSLMLNWAVTSTGTLSMMSSMMGTTNPTTVEIANANFTKYELYSEIETSATQEKQTYEVGKWLDIKIEDGKIVLTADLNAIFTKLPEPQSEILNASLKGEIYLKIYRGEDLEPLLAKHILPITVTGNRTSKPM